MPAHLIIRSDAGTHETLLAAGSHVIGRDADCDIVIDSPSIRPRHARIDIAEDHFSLEDLNETAETVIAGESDCSGGQFNYPQTIQLGSISVEVRRADEMDDHAETVAPSAPFGATVQSAPGADSVPAPVSSSETGLGFTERYRLGGEIARGGMGSIHEAREASLDRTVAMKVMLREAEASDDARKRFELEAAVLGRLEHPNIVPIHELSRDDQGRLFYTMKKVEGRTLQSIITGLKRGDPETLRQYSLDQLLSVFRKICDAMAFAHSQGVIHRDLKPENVMVGAFGEVLVMDWGLAKILRDGAAPSRELESSASPTGDLPSGFQELTDVELNAASEDLTLAGTVMGSPQYMPPEQAEGRVSDLDERSDIFSLGGILYAILALRPPVAGRSVREVLENVKSGNITPPSLFGSVATRNRGSKLAAGEVVDVSEVAPLPHCPGGRAPTALSAVVMKALAFEKSDRYGEVMELEADVRSFQQGFATTAEDIGTLGRFVLFVKRNQILSGAAALILFLSVGFMIQLNAEKQTATTEAANARIAEAVAKDSEKETKKALAKSAISLAEASFRAGNSAEMKAALETTPEGLRDPIWHYLLGESDRSVARLLPGMKIRAVVAHPILPSVFGMVDSRGVVHFVNVRSGKTLSKINAALGAGRHEYRLAISPDGRHLAIGCWSKEPGVSLHSTVNGKKLREWPANRTRILTFSRDGRQLMLGEENSAKGGDLISVLDVETGKRMWRQQLRGELFAIGEPPGGDSINLQSAGQIKYLAKGSGNTRHKIAGNHADAAAYHPDGNLLIQGSRSGMVTAFDMAEKRKIYQASFTGRPIGKIVFTADGERFVTLSEREDGNQTILVADSKTGGIIQSILGGVGPVTDAAIHPLSGELVACGSETRAWTLGAPRWTLAKKAGNKWASLSFWGNDDLVLATTPKAHSAVLQQLTQPNGADVRWIPGLHIRAVDVSADGQIAAIGTLWGSADPPIRLLRREGPLVEEIGEFNPPDSLGGLALSPRGTRLATTLQIEKIGLHIHDINGKSAKLATKNIKRYSDVDWLGEDRLLGLVTYRARRPSRDAEEKIVVWDLTTGKILRSVAHDRAMDALAVSPDFKQFAEAGADMRIRIRDAANLKIQKEFRAHNGNIVGLAWHPEGRVLASASTDLSVRLWNLQDGTLIEELRGIMMAPHTLVFSPSGKRVGVAAHNGAVRIWEPVSLNGESREKRAKAEHDWFAGIYEPEPSTDTGEWFDLLNSVSPYFVDQIGRGWKMEEGQLLSPKNRPTTLTLPADCRNASYRLRLRLRQNSPREGIRLILSVGDRSVGFEVDGFGGKYTGLAAVNGKQGEQLPGVVKGRQITDSDWHDLEVVVSLDGQNAKIETILDGRPLYDWTGAIAALSHDKAWSEVLRRDANWERFTFGGVALGTYTGGWTISEMKVKRQ